MVSGAHRSWSGIGNVEAHAGDIIMVNPGEMHDGMPLGAGPREWRMLYFDPAVATDLVEAEGATGIEVMRPAVSDRVLAARFVALFGNVIDKSPDPLLLEENLLRLIMRLSRYYCLRPPPGRERSAPVKKALARLDDGAASPIRLSELADLAGLSRFQLLRAFRREVGTALHAYLIQRRVHLARRLLAGGRPIVEAAIEAGFADQSHLTRAFVRQFGITPGRYVAARA